MPDYFGGHHLPYLQIPVDGETTKEQLKQQLKDELNQGAIGGNQLYDVTESDLFHYLANQAINHLVINSELPFEELEPFNEHDESVYAYFLLIPYNHFGDEVKL
ncbi:hypothetical protein OAO65_02125 [Flavobacteriales bacterium]|nr:hypothetical protein [Flavobacteriales bacterium]